MVAMFRKVVIAFFLNTNNLDKKSQGFKNEMVKLLRNLNIFVFLKKY
jgi:hypothetical protein